MQNNTTTCFIVFFCGSVGLTANLHIWDNWGYLEWFAACQKISLTIRHEKRWKASADTNLGVCKFPQKCDSRQLKDSETAYKYKKVGRKCLHVGNLYILKQVKGRKCPQSNAEMITITKSMSTKFNMLIKKIRLFQNRLRGR